MPTPRILFLDRDGVINADAGYVGTQDRFSFLPGVFPFLRAIRGHGYRLAILTNQSGVARGYFTAHDYNKLTEHVLYELGREGISIDLVLSCFEHPEGKIEAFSRQSFWRKPRPGMILQALRQMGAQAEKCAFLGDSPTDMQAAKAAHIAKCLWLTNEQTPAPDGVCKVRCFDEALAALLTRPAP